MTFAGEKSSLDIARIAEDLKEDWGTVRVPSSQFSKARAELGLQGLQAASSSKKSNNWCVPVKATGNCLDTFPRASPASAPRSSSPLLGSPLWQRIRATAHPALWEEPFPRAGHHHPPATAVIPHYNLGSNNPK